MPSKLGVGDSASSWFVSQDSTLIQAVFVVKGFFGGGYWSCLVAACGLDLRNRWNEISVTSITCIQNSPRISECGDRIPHKEQMKVTDVNIEAQR